jgi:hypothetical protein
MNQHDIDRPDEQLTALMREALDDLENEIFNGKTTVQVLRFSRMVMAVIQPYFDIPEFKQIENIPMA